MERPNFCTTVFPYEYDYIGQFEEAVKSANKYHKTIHKECPPPYYHFDMGKLYGLVATAQEVAALRSQLVECEKVAEALKSRLDENSNGDLADYDAFDMYEAYKSAHPTEKG